MSLRVAKRKFLMYLSLLFNQFNLSPSIKNNEDFMVIYVVRKRKHIEGLERKLVFVFSLPYLLCFLQIDWLKNEMTIGTLHSCSTKNFEQIKIKFKHLASMN